MMLFIIATEFRLKRYIIIDLFYGDILVICTIQVILQIESYHFDKCIQGFADLSR